MAGMDRQEVVILENLEDASEHLTYVRTMARPSTRGVRSNYRFEEAIILLRKVENNELAQQSGLKQNSKISNIIKRLEGLIKKNGLKERGDDDVIIDATNVLIEEIDEIRENTERRIRDGRRRERAYPEPHGRKKRNKNNSKKSNKSKRSNRKKTSKKKK